ncbi:MAG: hypothetical protein GY801_24895 [bacterium]|nr:hypothetical protein [bacterium]
MTSVLPAAAQKTLLPEIDKYFAVGFEQNGQLIPIENHQVTLQKKTFSIVIYFKEPGSVLVNSSLYPESLGQARDGVPFERIRGFADLGMAEEPFNPKTLLMLSKQAPHYWYYEHDTSHRFNDVSRQKGLLVCRRITAQVMYRDKERNMVPVKNMRENAIYFVFMRTMWKQDFSRQFEQQREYVKVNFR